MDHISKLLPKVLNKRGLNEQALAAQVCWLAKKWLLEHLPKAEPLLHVSKYSNGELIITSEHATASQECQLVSADLLAYLEEKLPQVTIQNIRIIREK